MFDKYTYSQHNTTRQNAATVAFSASPTPNHLVDYQLVAILFQSFVALQLAKIKKIRLLLRLLLAATLFFQSLFSLQAQNTGGREFWVTFGYAEQIFALAQTDFRIRIVNGEKQTTGYIYFTELDTYEHFTINPNTVYDYALTEPQKLAVYNLTMGTSYKSAYIYCVNPVTVYAGALRVSTGDVTNVLPITALNTEYYHISYETMINNNVFFDAYAVVATHNNTQVFHNNILEATLQKGEVYYRTYYPDMTGAHITSNNPVAFFAVHQMASIPPGFTTNTFGRLFQQLAPVNTWGKTFFVPVTLHQYNYARIVASRDGTDITQIGGTIRTVPGGQTNLTNLQAGQFVELNINLADSGCYITANFPVAICSYLPRGLPTIPVATPAQCWIPGIEQTVPRAMIAPFQMYSVPTGVPCFVSNATIVTKTATRDNTKVSIDGAALVNLTGVTWRANAASGMSFCHFTFTNDNSTYTFFNPEGIITFGFGTPPSSTITSYYYLAYSAMRDLQATFYANDISYQLLKENDFCEGDVHFLAEIEGLHPTHPERLTWWINGTEYLPAKNLEQWSKPFSVGEYEIEMKVRYVNDETASKTGTLIIKSCNQSAAFFANNVLHSALKDTTFCNKNVNFRAEIEGLHPTATDRIKWYVDGNEETTAQNLTEWSRPFENGTYEIKLVVHYDNDTYATLTGTLKIQALWIKIRNVRY